MDYKETHFTFLQEDCAGEFGQEKGADIFARSCERAESLLGNADFRGSDAIKEHMEKNMLPIVAYYLTLLDDGYSKEEAYELALKVTQKASQIQKRKNEGFGRIPFAYHVFKFLVKGMMKKGYPVEGWETEWVRFDGKEIQMDFKRCIYVDVTSQCGCPELCSVFCKNDDVVLSAYEPKILFRRSGTLAEGAASCDFHFLNGSKRS